MLFSHLSQSHRSALSPYIRYSPRRTCRALSMLLRAACCPSQSNISSSCNSSYSSYGAYPKSGEQHHGACHEDVFILAGLIYIFGSEFRFIAQCGIAEIEHCSARDTILIRYANSVLIILVCSSLRISFSALAAFSLGIDLCQTCRLDNRALSVL